MSQLLSCAVLLLTILQSSLARGLAGDLTIVSNTYCDDCSAAVRSYQTSVAQLDAVRVGAFLETQFCVHAVDTTKCVQLVRAHTPVFLVWVKEAFNPVELCSAEEVCGWKPQPHSQESAQTRDVSNSECSMCKYVVEGLAVIFNMTDVTDASLENAAKEICEVLPNRLQEGCLDFMHTYEARLVALADLFRDPSAACKIAGACMTDLLKHRLPALPWKLAEGAILVHQALAVTGDLCNSCKSAVAAVHKWLTDPNVHNAIMEYVQSLCQQLPALQNECTDEADQIVTAFLAALAEQVEDPAAACVALGFCPHQTSLVQRMKGALLINPLVANIAGQ